MQVCRRLSATRHRGWLGAVATAALLIVLIPPAPPARADTFDDACATPTIVDVGGSTTYNLTASDILFIDTGTYTGTINNFPSGSVICVDTGAVFQPGALNGSVAGSLYVRGTATLSVGGFAGGFLLDNYGTVSFPGTLNCQRSSSGASTGRQRP